MESEGTENKATEPNDNAEDSITYSLNEEEITKLFQIVYETQSDDSFDSYIADIHEIGGVMQYRIEKREKRPFLSLMKMKEEKEYVIRTILKHFDFKAPVKVGRPKQNNICIMCIEELKSGELIRKLPCSHSFHRECIDEWLIQKMHCPLCRGPFPEITVPTAADLFLQILKQRLSKEAETSSTSLAIPPSILNYLNSIQNE